MYKLNKINLLANYLDQNDKIKLINKQNEFRDKFAFAILSGIKYKQMKINEEIDIWINDISDNNNSNIQAIVTNIKNLDKINYENIYNLDLFNNNVCDCGETSLLQYDSNYESMYCLNCNKYLDIKSLVFEGNSTKSSIITNNYIKELELLNENLRMIQGLPPTKKTSMLMSDSSDYNTIIKYITTVYGTKVQLNEVRQVIDNLKMRRHDKWAFYIYIKITKGNPILFSDEELNFFKQKYLMILKIVENTKMKEKHMPSLSLILYKLLELCNLIDVDRKKIYLNNIHKSKPETLIKFNNEFWKSVCEESKKYEFTLIYNS